MFDSNPRVHLQEESCICSYGKLCFTCIGTSNLEGRRVCSTRTRGFIFRKTVVYTVDVRQHRTHSPTDPCKMYHIKTAYTTLFLKMNSRVRVEQTLLPPRLLILMYVNTYHSITVSRVSSVSITTRYGLDGQGIEFRWGRNFPHLSRPDRRPTQPPIQWVPGLSRG